MKRNLFFISFLFFSSIFAFAAKITLPVNAEETGYDEPVDITVEWDETVFTQQSPTVYNHDIARMACILSEVSYVNLKKDPELNQLKNVYRKLGVSDNFIECHYDIDYSAPGYGNNQAAYSFAAKEINTNKGTKNLIFVTIRGTPYVANEWISNVNVADSNRKYSEMHEGFFQTESKIHTNLIYFLLKKRLNPDDSYFLITGHSRGAAVANILGAHLIDEDFFKADRFFVYTFASPNVTQEKNVTSQKYNHIWNIVNPEDIVPTVPMRKNKWKFNKYGHTIAFSNIWNTQEEKFLNDYMPRINNYFSSLMKRNYYPFHTGFYIPALITKIITKLYPTIKNYYGPTIGLRYKAEKIFNEIYPPDTDVNNETTDISTVDSGKTDESESKETKSVFDSVNAYLNRITNGLLEYSSYAFLDMHICTNYLSWMLALNEEEAFSDQESSIIFIRGAYECAIFDSDNNIVTKIIDGMPQLSSIKPPIIAIPSPAGVIIGVPSSRKYTVVVYHDSLIPTAIPVKIEHYDSTGYSKEICPKKNLWPHKGSAYTFTIGKETTTQKQIQPTRNHSRDTKKYIKEAKLKQQDVFRIQPVFTIDTDLRFEGGIRIGTQMFHGEILTGQSVTDFGDSIAINLGIGHEETFLSRTLIDFSAYGKFLAATGTLEDEENRFNFIPSARVSFSFKPMHRLTFFVSGVFDFNISDFNDKAFSSDIRNNHFGTIKLYDGIQAIPSIRFGFRL